MSNKITINGLDAEEILKFLSKKNRRYQAMQLDDIEIILGKTEEFSKVRKIILDYTNEYTRSVAKLFLGDIEGLHTDDDRFNSGY
jgi:phage-related tail protein